MSRPDQLLRFEDIEGLLSELTDARGEGQKPLADAGDTVVEEALRMAGFRYRITREQRPGLIDCSSLVAQSHWFGAAVGTPFIAETQRLAYSAIDVTELPRRQADVLIRWPSRQAAPGGRHNHVALFLGRDRLGDDWALESAEELGVRAVRIRAPEWALGGVRRFLPDGGYGDASTFSDALCLARGVPKLGRLGARLTAGYDPTRRHRGVDVYVPSAMIVRAPQAGRLTFTDAHATGHGDTALIEGVGSLTLLGPIAVRGRAPSGMVDAGDIIGTVGDRSASGCNTVPVLRLQARRLHMEYWAKEMPYTFENGLQLERRRDLRAYNPILAVRLGLLRTILSDGEQPLDLRPRAQPTVLSAGVMSRA